MSDNLSISEIVESLKQVMKERTAKWPAIEENENIMAEEDDDDEDIFELTAQEPKNAPEEVETKIDKKANRDSDIKVTSKRTVEDNSSLLSEHILHDIDNTVKLLTNTLSADNDQLFSSQLREKVIEDLVKELLKPYLKEWLNNNLPSLVKQVVLKEISKLISKE